MAFIEAHQSLRDHRKILALAADLDMPEPHVAGHCLYLWLWSLDNAPEGALPGSERIIEKAAGWSGAPGVLVAALVRAGMLDRADDGVLYIHDWWDYAGRLIEKRKADAARKRESRASISSPQDIQRTSNGHPRDGAGTVPNTTVENTTSPSGGRITSQSTAEAERAKDSAKSPMPLAAIFGGDGGAEPLNLFVARVASAAGMRQYNAATFSNILAPYHARSPDRVVSEAAAAAEWIADPRQNKKRTQMSITFLHRWLDRGFNTPQGQNGHARHDSTETDSEHLSLDERRKRREAREASERGERQRERANLTARLGPPGTQRHPAG